MTRFSRSRQTPRRTEAELSFMLGGQALARWKFRLTRLQQLAADAAPGERESLLMETQLGLKQMASLAGRMQTFCRSRVLPIRFEAQEMLVSIERLQGQLAHIERQLSEHAPVRPAKEVEAALLGRRRRSRGGPPATGQAGPKDTALAPS